MNRQQVVQLDATSIACAVCGDAHKGLIITFPKTASGDARVVDLGGAAIGVLLARRLEQDALRGCVGDAYSDHGLVFARPTGKPIRPERVTKKFARLVKASGLRETRLHDLRHARASLLLASGTDIALVSKILGHSSIAITADTYSHLLQGVGRTAAEAAEPWCPGGLVTNR